jgi:EAL domain-containing protein (putative c-di-GMP-specific phosphodiesterase class I)
MPIAKTTPTVEAAPAPSTTPESLGWQLRAALPPMRLHSITLCDHTGDVLWLSEGALGPDEHGFVSEAIEASKSDNSLSHIESDLQDGRYGVFLPVRSPQGELVALVMILADSKGLGSKIATRILSQQTRLILQKIAIFLRPHNAAVGTTGPHAALSANAASSQGSAVSASSTGSHATAKSTANAKPAPASNTARPTAKQTNSSATGTHATKSGSGPLGERAPVMPSAAPIPTAAAAPAHARSKARAAKPLNRAGDAPIDFGSTTVVLSPLAVDDILSFELVDDESSIGQAMPVQADPALALSPTAAGMDAQYDVVELELDDEPVVAPVRTSQAEPVVSAPVVVDSSLDAPWLAPSVSPPVVNALDHAPVVNAPAADTPLDAAPSLHPPVVNAAAESAPVVSAPEANAPAGDASFTPASAPPANEPAANVASPPVVNAPAAAVAAPPAPKEPVITRFDDGFTINELSIADTQPVQKLKMPPPAAPVPTIDVPVLNAAPPMNSGSHESITGEYKPAALLAAAMARDAAAAAAQPSAPPAPTVEPRRSNTAPKLNTHVDPAFKDLALSIQLLSKLRPGGRTRRFEVLLRSKSDPTAIAAADEIMRSLDQSADLDGFVVSQLLTWLAEHPEASEREPLTFSINLSARALHDERFPEFVAMWLRKSGVAAESIGFELSESIIANNKPQAERFVAACEKLGCFIVLDDFSMDSRAIEFLRSKALKLIKIESKLTNEAMKDKLSQAMVIAISQAAKVLGVHCAAKKIESQMVRRWITAIGFDFAQGTLFESPQHIDELLTISSH